MKAIYFNGPGTPFDLRDTAIPEPGPGEVRIQTRASGICGTDVHYWRGDLEVASPWIFGHEPVGMIDALGPGVTKLKKGDRVGVSWVQEGCGRCNTCQSGKPDYCAGVQSWMELGGGHRDFMIAKAAGCTPLPEGLDWPLAAPLFCAGYTVMSGYRNARMRPGDRVAVAGVGGLGHIAIQIAKAHGHEVIGVTANENKRGEILALGADDVLVIREHAGHELAAMGGADIVLSTTNNMRHNSELLLGIRDEGKLISMAISPEPITVDPLHLLSHQISLVGSQQSSRADLVEVLALAARGKVKPGVEVYAPEEINKVMERLEAGHVRYRAVLDFGGW